jgi:hypothetical protein
MPVKKEFDMTPSPSVKFLGAAVICATVILYVIFW